MVQRQVRRTDITAYHLSATDMGNDIGSAQIANVILLTIRALASEAITLEPLQKVISLSIKRKNLFDITMKAIEVNIALLEKNGVTA